MGRSGIGIGRGRGGGTGLGLVRGVVGGTRTSGLNNPLMVVFLCLRDDHGLGRGVDHPWEYILTTEVVGRKTGVVHDIEEHATRN